MPDKKVSAGEIEGLRVQIKSIADNFNEFKEDFKLFKNDMKKSFISRDAHELAIKKAMETHVETKHKPFIGNQKVIMGLLLFCTATVGGMSGDTLVKILTKVFSG